jgi:AcrR family transcriptional regulator
MYLENTKKTRLSKTLKQRIAVEKSTEQKIISAARTLFSQKGFDNTRNRDIAKLSGVNLALVNYHFSSKEMLYNVIMKDTISEFVNSLDKIFNDKKTTIERKFELLSTHFIDRLMKEPDIAIFIIDEIRNQPSSFIERLPDVSEISDSVVVQQFQQAMADGKINETKNPLVFMPIILSLAVFPFLFNNIFEKLFGMNNKQLKALMEERKRLVPGWINSIIFK